MKSGTLRTFSKVGFALSVAAVAFHLIAFTSNSWADTKYENTTFRAGLWYITTCDGNVECKTVSRRKWFEEAISYFTASSISAWSYAAGVGITIAYSHIVRSQVVLTITLLYSILCVVMFVIALCRQRNDGRIRLVIFISSVLSGILTVQELAIAIRHNQIALQSKKIDVYFPWCLVAVFFAAFLNLSVACINFILEWKVYQSRNQQLWQNLQQGAPQCNQSNYSSGTFSIVISVVFQIIAYASNGWRMVETENTYDWEMGITESTSRHFGLWFLTECFNDDCETMSMRKYFKTKYGSLERFDYSRQVRSQIFLTLSLMLSFICLLLLVIESRRVHSNRLKRLCIILSSLLSGIFWLYDVAYYIRMYVIDTKYNNDYRTTLFPWSLIFALLGTIIILVFSFLRFVKELKVKEINSAEVTNNIAINLLEINTNAENDLTENSVNLDADEH